MRIAVISLVSGLALLVTGCGKQRAAAAQASEPRGGISNPVAGYSNIEKRAACIAAVGAKFAAHKISAKEQDEESAHCDKKYPLQ